MNHYCSKCKQAWNCLCFDDECEMGIELTCPICNAREKDYNPDTHIQYKGAFKEWEKSVV